MEAGRVVVSLATYEGSLIGLSAKSAKEVVSEQGEGLMQEYAFAASEGSLSCMASEGNLMAVAGSEEVIKMFDLKSKISCGELSGTAHNSTITALAVAKQCNHLLSGDEKGIIGIWRVKDQELLHKLEVKNTSKVVSLSMHDSGRMLLALYANGVLRLWNMLDARCLFKKKVGMSIDKPESEDEIEDVKDAVEEEKEDIKASKKLETEKSRRIYRSFDRQRAEKVMWEPTQGKHYAVLFSHVLEIFTVECDEPIHSITFDTNQTSFTYLGRLMIVVCDEKGRLSVLHGVDKQSGV